MSRKQLRNIDKGETVNFWDSVFFKFATKLLLIGLIVFILLTVFSGP